MGFPNIPTYDKMHFWGPAQEVGDLYLIGRRFVDISDTDIVLTRGGYEAIQRELNEIISVKRPAVVNRIREARQLGDLKENFDYQDAKQSQGLIEARIRELEAILIRATVVDGTGEDGTVTIGSKVMVKDVEDGFEEEFSLVGPAESNPTAGKISHESCIGAALMGHKVGDVVSAITPGGVIKFEIVSVQ